MSAMMTRQVKKEPMSLDESDASSLESICLIEGLGCNSFILDSTCEVLSPMVLDMISMTSEEQLEAFQSLTIEQYRRRIIANPGIPTKLKAHILKDIHKINKIVLIDASDEDVMLTSDLSDSEEKESEEPKQTESDLEETRQVEKTMSRDVVQYSDEGNNLKKINEKKHTANNTESDSQEIIASAIVKLKESLTKCESPALSSDIDLVLDSSDSNDALITSTPKSIYHLSDEEVAMNLPPLAIIGPKVGLGKKLKADKIHKNTCDSDYEAPWHTERREESLKNEEKMVTCDSDGEIPGHSESQEESPKVVKKEKRKVILDYGTKRRKKRKEELRKSVERSERRKRRCVKVVEDDSQSGSTDSEVSSLLAAKQADTRKRLRKRMNSNTSSRIQGDSSTGSIRLQEHCRRKGRVLDIDLQTTLTQDLLSSQSQVSNTSLVPDSSESQGIRSSPNTASSELNPILRDWDMKHMTELSVVEACRKCLTGGITAANLRNKPCAECHRESLTRRGRKEPQPIILNTSGSDSSSANSRPCASRSHDRNRVTKSIGPSAGTSSSNDTSLLSNNTISQSQTNQLLTCPIVLLKRLEAHHSLRHYSVHSKDDPSRTSLVGKYVQKSHQARKSFKMKPQPKL